MIGSFRVRTLLLGRPTSSGKLSFVRPFIAILCLSILFNLHFSAFLAMKPRRPMVIQRPGLPILLPTTMTTLYVEISQSLLQCSLSRFNSTFLYYHVVLTQTLLLAASQIDWQPDTLTFAIDNNTVRTIKKSDTIDGNGVAHYPSTPSSVQLRCASFFSHTLPSLSAFPISLCFSLLIHHPLCFRLTIIFCPPRMCLRS